MKEISGTALVLTPRSEAPSHIFSMSQEWHYNESRPIAWYPTPTLLLKINITPPSTLHSTSISSTRTGMNASAITNPSLPPKNSLLKERTRNQKYPKKKRKTNKGLELDGSTSSRILFNTIQPHATLPTQTKNKLFQHQSSSVFESIDKALHQPFLNSNSCQTAWELPYILYSQPPNAHHIAITSSSNLPK